MRTLLTPILLATALIPMGCKGHEVPGNANASPAPEAATEHHTGHAHGAHGAESASTNQAAAPAGRVFFIEPAAGAQVTSPFRVRFGVEGRRVRPAGEDINDQESGHHHLLIDTDGLAAGSFVPKDAQHIHYGGGQTEAMITLSPGTHKLTMQFADGAHRSYGPQWSAAIEVVVAAPAAGEAAP